MSPRQLFRQISIALITLSIPLSSSAASITATVKAADDAVMNRGDFIRASITALDIPVSRSTTATDYARPVPKALVPYVNAAKAKSALSVFGEDLGLSKTITRGEAAIVLTQLMSLKPVAKNVTFSDAPSGSALEAAVRIVTEKNWMKPVRSNFFGVSRSLTGREAKSLLAAATGKSSTTIETGGEPKTQTTTTVIQVKQREAAQLPESDMLRAVWQLLNDQYLYKDKLDNKEAAYDAAEALVNSVGDQYTTFMRPADAKSFQEQLGGEISGIGAQVEYVNNGLTIVAPISGSPAEKAGIKAGDRITAVDGVSLADLNLAKAVEKVRGPKGTVVKLTIVRDGTTMEISVTRGSVRLPEIDISVQNGIAVVKLAQFGQTTDKELRPLMVDIQNQKPKGIVLDLRNNPGGLLHAAEMVLSNFLPKGSAIAVIKSRADEYNEVTADEPTISEDIPVVVLVNKGSASASEIVAGAMQDYKRATILGEKSFGKGTVQQIIEFRDGSSMKMTIAEWLTPLGRKINGVGVTPDVTVTTSADRDEQLLRAIDLLR